MKSIIVTAAMLITVSKLGRLQNLPRDALIYAIKLHMPIWIIMPLSTVAANNSPFLETKVNAYLAAAEVSHTEAMDYFKLTDAEIGVALRHAHDARSIDFLLQAGNPPAGAMATALRNAHSRRNVNPNSCFIQ